MPQDRRHWPPSRPQPTPGRAKQERCRRAAAVAGLRARRSSAAATSASRSAAPKEPRQRLPACRPLRLQVWPSSTSRLWPVARRPQHWPRSPSQQPHQPAEQNVSLVLFAPCVPESQWLAWVLPTGRAIATAWRLRRRCGSRSRDRLTGRRRQ
jgi:hypothetical protein